MIEVWYCKTEQEISDLMAKLENERPKLYWRAGQRPTGWHPGTSKIWFLAIDNELSANYPNGSPTCLTEQENTDYILSAFSEYATKASDIIYHTTMPDNEKP